MKNGSIQLMDLEFEYKIWKKRLDLFLKEVDVLISRNLHLSPEWKHNSLNSIELLALEEHKDNLNKLRNRIEVKEQELRYYNKDFPITEQHDYYLDHLDLRHKNDQSLAIHLDRISDIIKAIGV